VAATSGLDSIINIVRVHRLRLFGYVARFSRDIPVSNILIICCASRYGLETPPLPFHEALRTTWLDHISSDTGMSLTDTFSLAQYRSECRPAATAIQATRIWLTDWRREQWRLRTSGPASYDRAHVIQVTDIKSGIHNYLNAITNISHKLILNSIHDTVHLQNLLNVH